MSLLLDIEEVRALVHGADYDGFTAYDLQNRLQMHGGPVRRLIAAGHLKSITVVTPVSRCSLAATSSTSAGPSTNSTGWTSKPW